MTSLITIGVGLIFLVTLFRIWSKHRKGLRLSRLEKLALIVTILAGVVYLIIEVASRLPFLVNYLGFQIIIPPIVSWGVLIIFAIVTLVILVKRFKQIPAKPSFDSKFSHIETHLFYNPKHRWEKTRVLTKHWWEFWKQAPSHHKLVLVKDLRKAYYVGTYVWNLIVEGKVEWFSEDDQDLEEWYKKEGYTLIKEDASEQNFLEPYFEAEIVDKKTEYRRGESVYFRTHYRGKLINGFFDNEMTPLSGELFSDGRTSDWKWSPETMDNPYGEGKLDGYIDHQERWNWTIPLDAPTGQYRVIMGVHNHFYINTRPRVQHKEETITITKKPDLISNKPQVIKPEYDFSSFDIPFKALQYMTEPKTKEIMMREFQPKLRDLCYDAVWNDETRMRVIKVLDYIPEKLSEDPNIDYYLHFIGLIIHKDIEQIKNSVKEKFLEELEKLYDDPRYETNKQILNLLQKIHEYSEDYMMKLIDEAGSIVKWSDQRFQVQALDIQLWELRNRDQNAYDRVLKHLRRKMNDAEKNNDEKNYERLKKLYELVKR